MSRRTRSEQVLAQLVNQTVYLGIRRLDQDGTVVSEDSALGTITAAGENGIFITKTDGSEQKLPPAAAAFNLVHRMLFKSKRARATQSDLAVASGPR